MALADGNGDFQAQRTYSAGAYPSSVAIGDVNGDGILDIVVANELLRVRSAYCLATATAPSRPTQTFATGAVTYNEGVSLAVGDLTGDGKPDIVVATEASNAVSVLVGNGDGTFQAPHRPSPREPKPARVQWRLAI